jgi:hypothetical protein
MKRGCMLKLEMIQSYTMKIEVSEEFVMNQKFNVSYLIELLPDEKPESPDKPAKD